MNFFCIFLKLLCFPFHSNSPHSPSSCLALSSNQHFHTDQTGVAVAYNSKQAGCFIPIIYGNVDFPYSSKSPKLYFLLTIWNPNADFLDWKKKCEHMQHRIVAAGRCKKEVFILWCVIFHTVWYGHNRNLQAFIDCSAVWIKIEATSYLKSVSVYIYEHTIFLFSCMYFVIL